MFRRVGVLALMLSAGMAVLQPTAAKAEDWHDRDNHHDRRDRRDWDRHRDRDRDWRRNEWREREQWENRRDRDYLYFNYAPAQRPYYYAPPAPTYSYPYNAYPYNGYPY